jgi:hypothetical protein
MAANVAGSDSKIPAIIQSSHQHSRTPIRTKPNADKVQASLPPDTKYKQWQWLSTLGKVPLFDSTYALTYHRKLTSKLGFDLGGQVLDWDYSSGNLSTCRRNDIEYTATAGLTYAVNSHLSLNAGCAFDWGRNLEDGIENPQNREFDHQLFSLGAVCKF